MGFQHEFTKEGIFFIFIRIEGGKNPINEHTPIIGIVDSPKINKNGLTQRGY